jgi:hypothetical protein
MAIGEGETLIVSEEFTVSFADWTLVPPEPVQLIVYV